MDEAGGAGGDDATLGVTRPVSRARQRRDARKANRKARNQRYRSRRKARLAKTAVWGYDGLVSALVARRHALGWSQLELDERAGFQSGYTAKLENWRGPQGRVAGSVTMPLWLQALGVGFVPVALFEGHIGDQQKRLEAIVRPQLGAAEHNRRIPKGDE